MPIISFINLKGGVGKTTCCVAMAEFLSGHYRRRVLVIDLDPQTNATTALVAGERWQKADEAGQTLRQMFFDQFVPPGQRAFGMDRAIMDKASDVEECASRLSLLPSSIDLIGMEAMVEMVRAASRYTIEPYQVLDGYLTPVRSKFDYILIDCPPSLNAVTLNGLYVSDAYLVPVLPEPVATMGITALLTRLARFQSAFGRGVPPLGIIFNCFDFGPKSKQQKLIVDEVRARKDYPTIFDTLIPLRQSSMLAVRYEDSTRRLSAKYTSTDGTPNTGSTYETWAAATKEFENRCQALAPVDSRT